MKRKYILSIMGVFAATLVLTNDGTGAAQPFQVQDKAARAIEEGRIDDARQELTAFRRREPDNPWGLFYLARIEEDYRRALWIYKEVERLAGTGSSLAAEALLARAEIAYAQEHLDEAKELYQQLADTWLTGRAVCDAQYRLGTISLAEGEPQRAIEQFEACIALADTSIQALYAHAGIMEAQVVLEQWRKALDAAVEVLAGQDDLSAMTPRVLEVMALSWEKLGNQENAIRYRERLLSNYPWSYQAFDLRERADIPKGETVILSSGDSGDGRSVSESGTPGGLQPDTIVQPSSARFSVQTGAFTDRNNALKLIRSLRDAGFDARVEMRTVQQSHFYVIRVGYFATREAADTMAGRIATATGARPNVVVLETP
jgi:tetratricopeptide (TPR) repeat protein